MLALTLGLLPQSAPCEIGPISEVSPTPQQPLHPECDRKRKLSEPGSVVSRGISATALL